MNNLNTISSRVVAAVSSLALSVVIFAAAIMPANQGAILPLVA
ncbi:hypothetical protein [Pontixanthobacter sp.]